jgi:hypothetical protein
MPHAEQPAPKQREERSPATREGGEGGLLSERLGQSARMVAQRRQLAAAFGSQAPVVQAKWKPFNKVVMVWDRPLGGLRWFYNTEDGLMWFKVVTSTNDDDLNAALRELSELDLPHEEWLNIWDERGWIEPGGENDLSYINDESGKKEWWPDPEVPYAPEWWDTKAQYRAEREPRPLPTYRQQWTQSCSIEAMRMVAEGLTGVPVDRDDLLDYLEQRVMTIEQIKKGGLLFDNLPKVFDEYFRMGFAARAAKDPEALAGLLTGGCALLLEVKAHVIVVDAVSGTVGHRRFAIRDPAHGDIEDVAQDDPRLKGTGRVLVVYGS